MRNLIYSCTKGNATIETGSFSEMEKLVADGFTAEIHLEEIYEEFHPTEKRKEIIIK